MMRWKAKGKSSLIYCEIEINNQRVIHGISLNVYTFIKRFT